MVVPQSCDVAPFCSISPGVPYAVISHSTRAGGLLSAMIVLSLGIPGCGGDDLVLPSEGEPASIRVVQGDGQSGRVGEMLAQPVVVEVSDLTGRPVAGASVVFELTGSQPDTVTTDSDGESGARPVLGTSVGETSGAARVIVQEGQSPVETSFRVIAVPASANGLSLVSGDGQSAPINTTLPLPLVVKISDGFGNPVAGVEVQWTAALGGGSVSAGSTITDDQGLTSVQRTLGGAAGSQTSEARVDGLAGSPVVFTHTATAGPAAGVRIVSGNEQSGPVGSQLPIDFVVEVLDGGGNPVPSAPITWTVTGGGGSVSPASPTTDAAGRAAARLTLGTVPGPNTVDATVSGVGTATFTATATVGAAAGLAMQTQPSANATIGVPFGQQPVVQLKDASGNDVAQSGVTVIAAIASGAGQLVGTTTRSTDGNGRAAFTDLAIGAGGTHTLIFAAPGFTSVTSSAIEVGRASTTTTITSDGPDPSTVGQPVTVQFTVTFSGGTPGGTVVVSVSDGAETCSAAVSAGSCSITLSVAGSRTLTASFAGDASFEPSSDTESHDVQAANSAPTALDDGYTTLAGQPLTVAAPGVLANDSDPDGNALNAGPFAGPTANGTVNLQADGSFSYTPNIGFVGEDSFTYQATDGVAASGAATVRITVQQ